MATRPVFRPDFSGDRPGVLVDAVAFPWSAGLSLVQKRKNIASLHEAARRGAPGLRLLEVSRKSAAGLGVSLSAFNLRIAYRNRPGLTACVESLYQASKVFREGMGPFPAWYARDPRDVRQLVRDCGGTVLKAFRYGAATWPLKPMRAFYDWLYCKVLHANPGLVEGLRGYDAFTDIEFNPARSVNCQGYAVALYLSLEGNGLLEEALASKEAFLALHPADPPAEGATGNRARAVRPGPGATAAGSKAKTGKRAATKSRGKATAKKRGTPPQEDDGLGPFFQI